MEILESLQNSGFATWVRESPSLLGYPLFIALHTIGLGLLVGIGAGISFRILGVAADLPLAPMERYFRFMWLGFWINASSGVVLFITEPLKFLSLPVFYIKLAAIMVGLVAMRMLWTRVFLTPAVVNLRSVPAAGKALAGGVLAAWGAAILAGRVTSYDTSIQLETAVAVLIVAVVLAIAGAIVARRVRLGAAGSAGTAAGARRSHAA